MIKAEHIPDKVVEAAAMQLPGMAGHQRYVRAAIVAALNAWPGMDTGPNIYGRQNAIIHLPLTEKP